MCIHLFLDAADGQLAVYACRVSLKYEKKPKKKQRPAEQHVLLQLNHLHYIAKAKQPHLEHLLGSSRAVDSAERFRDRPPRGSETAPLDQTWRLAQSRFLARSKVSQAPAGGSVQCASRLAHEPRRAHYKFNMEPSCPRMMPLVCPSFWCTTDWVVLQRDSQDVESVCRSIDAGTRTSSSGLLMEWAAGAFFINRRV